VRINVKSLPQVQAEYLTSAYQLVLPETVLVGTACALFLLALVTPRRGPAVGVAALGLVAAAVTAYAVGASEVAQFWAVVEGTAYAPRTVAPFDPTGAAAFVRWLSLAAAGVFLLAGWPEVRDRFAPEYAACLLVVAAGASLAARANDLVALFLALELVSIPTYVLLYLPVRGKAGHEAAVKYFLLSVLASAVTLFGFSYLYGLTGTTNLGGVTDVLARAHQTGVTTTAVVAVMMVLAGLTFRIAAVPFHFYAPDVYEGGPTGVVAQLAFVPKVVGFLALARVLGLLDHPVTQLPFDAAHTLVPLMLSVIAAASMTFGNWMALVQTNLKRLLAYSGIAHAGYMLIGVVVACALPDAPTPGRNGLDAVLFYLVAYGLMTVGVFAVLLHLPGAPDSVDDLAGLGKTHPVSAVVLCVLLFSLIGLPLTAGFVGKFLLFVGALDAPAVGPMRNMYWLLAVVAVVNAAVGAVYYLRVLGVLYLRSPLKESEPRRLTPSLAAALVCAVLTVALGVYPKPLVQAARAAVPTKDARP
jgi:NADH-quinone oxidoreductase subunit N